MEKPRGFFPAGLSRPSLGLFCVAIPQTCWRCFGLWPLWTLGLAPMGRLWDCHICCGLSQCFKVECYAQLPGARHCKHTGQADHWRRKRVLREQPAGTPSARVASHAGHTLRIQYLHHSMEGHFTAAGHHTSVGRSRHAHSHCQQERNGHGSAVPTRPVAAADKKSEQGTSVPRSREKGLSPRHVLRLRPKFRY